MGNRTALFNLVFLASSQTLPTFGRDERYLGARLGIISVLLTWGQQISFHPHVHAIVSGGGFTCTGNWKEAKKNDYRFLFPVKAISVVYRGKFLQGLKRLIKSGEVVLPECLDKSKWFSLLYAKPWIVYAKVPFGGPEQVIEYLGRYTHKVAISNHRICCFDKATDTVTFHYKDYQGGSTQKQMTLSCKEFLRRFSHHIQPRGFTKIHSYGYLANRGREQRIKDMLLKLKLPQHSTPVQLAFSQRLLESYGVDVTKCPCRGNKTLRLMAVCYSFKGGEDS